jgi:hypothetical protein
LDPKALMTPNKLNSSSSSAASTSSNSSDDSNDRSSASSWSLRLGSPYSGRSRCSMTKSRAKRSMKQSVMQKMKGAFQPKWVYSEPPIGGA